MHQTLLLRPRTSNGIRSLERVAGEVFAALDLNVNEERESSNYEEGHYYLGYALNVDVVVCLSDGAEMPDYPYWLVLQEPSLRQTTTQEIESSPQAVATRLAATGFQVFIPTQGWGMVDWIPSGESYGG